MKSRFLSFMIVGFGVAVGLTGCSGKTQINPTEYVVSQKERDFESEQVLNKQLDDAFNRGDTAGYARAKAEFEKIIPYIEAIRASAELKKSGGLCLPPLFLDKSKGNSVAVLLGEAHVCNNLTVDEVLKAVKSGIPGLPDYVIKKSDVPVASSSSTAKGLAGIEIAGEEKKKAFIEDVTAVTPVVKIKVEDSYTNKNILRDSKLNYSTIEIDAKKYLFIEFENQKSATDFCSKYSICGE